MHISTIYIFFILVHTCNRKNTQTRILHLLVLTRVLLYHNAWNEKCIQYGLLRIFTDL